MILPVVPLADGDVWGYLGPALSALDGRGFVDTQQREWLYSAFVATAMGLGGAGGIVIMHCAASVAGVLALWLAWRGWLGMLPVPRPLKSAFMLPPLAVITAYLSNPDILLFEISLRPEALMIALAFVQLWLITEFVRFRWTVRQGVKAFLSGAAAIALACALFKLRPSWALAVPVTTLPVLAGVFGSGHPRWVRWGTPAFGTLLAVLLVFLPGNCFYIENVLPRTVLPMTLFTMNAETITKSMHARVAAGDVPDGRVEAWRSVLPVLEEELHEARKLARYYPSVGFDPDYLMYRARVFPHLVSAHGFDRANLADFCMETYRGAWITHPEGMAAKVVGQFSQFAFPDERTFIRRRIKTTKLYEGSAGFVPASGEFSAGGLAERRLLEYRAALEDASGQHMPVLVSPKAVHRFLRRIPEWVNGIAVLFLLAIVICSLTASLRQFVPSGLVALLYWATPAANALTVAMVHSLDNDRYRASYGPLLLFAVAAAATFVAAVSMAAIAPHARELINRLSTGRKVNTRPV
jgi:hypothetical protein